MGVVPVLKFLEQKRQKFASGMGDLEERLSKKKLNGEGPGRLMPENSSSFSFPASL